MIADAGLAESRPAAPPGRPRSTLPGFDPTAAAWDTAPEFLTGYIVKYGLSVVLVFVGLKMVWLNPWYGGKFPISYSLAFIGSVIAGSVILSFLIRKPRGVTPGPARRTP